MATGMWAEKIQGITNPHNNHTLYQLPDEELDVGHSGWDSLIRSIPTTCVSPLLRSLGSFLRSMTALAAQCRSSQSLHEHLSNLRSNLIEGQSSWSTSKVLVNTIAHIKTTQCIPYIASGIETTVERKEKATTETDTAGAWMEGRLNKLKIFRLLAFT